ncbi:MAG: hypothetical protein JW776_11425 [Candidatus Lokiarchaeota archaeon]|nr:hypothetical protein [Candidatus Lokiarchaeota archaeon]
MKKNTRLTILSIFLTLMIGIVPFVFLIKPAGANNDRLYSPDGKGYIEEIPEYPGKYRMHLEGTPYQMGEQQGYLGARSVSRLASEDWFKNIVTGLLDAPDFILDIILGDILDYNRLVNVVGSVVDYSILQAVKYVSGDSIDTMLDKLLVLCRALVAHNMIYVPEEFLTECQGVADGANTAGYDDVTYEDVLLLNMGMDALLALAYPVVEPWLFWMDLFSFLSCSGYVVKGYGTVGGHTIMGRHWQFSSYVLFEELMMIEYNPISGNRFISTSAPGFVGLTSAMNDQGIGIGQDMVPAQDCDPANYGMGTLFTARYVAQHCDQYSEAINFITSSVHGCSWIYGIGDGRNGETGGCALEISDNYYRVRDMRYTRPWWAIFSYDTIEKKNDLVTWTNHYIYVRMNDLADSTAIDDSKNRYSWLTNLALNMYGTIDLHSGATLIDYLHPPNYNYYTGGPDMPVGACLTAWDLTTLQAKALFGLYSDQWVIVTF